MICPACNKRIGKFHKTPNEFHRDCFKHWEEGYKTAMRFCEKENKIAGHPSPGELYSKRCIPCISGVFLKKKGK